MTLLTTGYVRFANKTITKQPSFCVGLQATQRILTSYLTVLSEADGRGCQIESFVPRYLLLHLMEGKKEKSFHVTLTKREQAEVTNHVRVDFIAGKVGNR
jgi:hypothetical protein